MAEKEDAATAWEATVQKQNEWRAMHGQPPVDWSKKARNRPEPEKKEKDGD